MKILVLSLISGAVAMTVLNWGRGGGRSGAYFTKTRMRLQGLIRLATRVLRAASKVRWLP